MMPIQQLLVRFQLGNGKLKTDYSLNPPKINLTSLTYSQNLIDST